VKSIRERAEEICPPGHFVEAGDEAVHQRMALQVLRELVEEIAEFCDANGHMRSHGDDIRRRFLGPRKCETCGHDLQ
jgi:hypothetical protein